MLEIVRLADRPDLIPVCARWNHDEWGHSAGISEQQIDRAFHNIARSDDGQTARVALWDHVPVGLSLLIHNDLETHAHLKPWLASLFVVPAFRGKGIGKGLVAAIEDAAAELGYGQVYLYTRTPVFYQQLGWSTFEELAGDHADMSILRKPLTR
ncbi:GNAT family N-acetyltransferase [Falsochrobactrum sp. TDYN1]|uniref:GNAT family N-acetyltransferase n=1 Tax=Falsochrobactrum tianjinense TaxID=2706015 RepID=A0A949PQW8_9HYPH|nr:GNAT family N-acetyltransferase [Falsochrobactrum sp. TDYN1]MBV2145039.1 GNAT family N-acetyltransferase [Falsochrobactrum sp. TDYN1]